MHLTINSNPSATSASLNLSQAMDAHRRSLARLSSGNRIVNPADDAGGLAVAKKLDSSLKRLVRVGQNLGNAQSFTELQETALRTVGAIITRMSELKTMSMDVSKNSADNENYNKEFVELQKQILAITKHRFNGVSLFSTNGLFVPTHEDGSPTKGLGLGRNFVFGEYVAESGAVLGQGTTTTTTSTGATSGGGSGGGSGAGGGESSTTYTLDQWRTDYDEWINYDDSNWDNDFATWWANPAPYGGRSVLTLIKNARDTGSKILDLGPYGNPPVNVRNISDLTPLAGLTNLEEVDLSNTQVTNLSPLANLSNLKRLKANTSVSFEDITPLAGLTGLEELWIQGNNISDISPLANLTNLEILSVALNKVENIAPLSSLSKLSRLYLQFNQIEDLSPLSGLNNLIVLGLFDNNISNLSPISGLTNLLNLSLENNPITQSQKDMLEAALPTTNITWPDPILPDPVEPEAPTTTITTTAYPSLDQFTTKDFTNFTEDIADALAEIGAHQSRLGFELRTNQISQVNNEAAVGRLMDVDIAMESTKLAQTSVKVQSASSMVAKANELTDIAIRMLINR